METWSCDVCVVGGTLEGVAAAEKAAEAGKRVILLPQHPLLGGQAISVPALDEHQWIEHNAGATRNYLAFRQSIRKHYIETYGLKQKSLRDDFGIFPTGPTLERFNPGNCWVSRLVYEPLVGEQKLQERLQPYAEGGVLKISEPVKLAASAHSYGNRERLASIFVTSLRSGETFRVEASYFIDATEYGDLIRLVGIPYRVGAESKDETAEPNAREKADPNCVQSFTYAFILEHCPGESHVIPKPPLYEYFRNLGLYTLHYPPNAPVAYGMFDHRKPQKIGSFWTYRRILDAEQFPGSGLRDLSLINWVSNDYGLGTIIDQPENVVRERLRQAKYQSLGFLYWLQTECPRDDGSGYGYPELRLRRDLMGTEDGLSMFPYLRESLRIIPRSGRPILEQEITSKDPAASRALLFDDSVGIGCYLYIDIHQPTPGPGESKHLYRFDPVKPYQIPLRAFMPIDCENVIPAGLHIGTTHITNGAYRLHPIVWATGEVAAMLASFSLDEGITPSAVTGEKYLRKFQRALLEAGMPIFWFDDVPIDHPEFEAIQFLAASGIYPVNHSSLSALPENILRQEEWQTMLKRANLAENSRWPQWRTRAEITQYILELLDDRQ